MSSFVNRVSADDEHIATLMGRAIERIADSFDDEVWRGLRPSQFRILEAIDRGSARSVDVARVLGMTKQGAGQHIAKLTDDGYLVASEDSGDRRNRKLRLTRKGSSMLMRGLRRIADIEDEWTGLVGSDDYAAFRRVLIEIGKFSERL
ncbi:MULTISPECIES: MarR family winged helix-turn-helix transcriptional regulator [unclassified Gordonia (in: high G+C Gram-positive bacteria)]|uniref:MarR family winged helix-turn-helix transcriptional regulator n=1 Tax=unclassified Gordonia (in: high G+C Gram-positive bacteria) TaxID=2657482 RepID=UPI001F1143FE|nr:helix-turn-helix domain-containing protein [Gordonia sp. ABSL49_1]MCH5642547.1 MarR family winged helix-turn-helix transcriptional regulator [Gordonia sp. ABSL49_1]